MSDCDCNGLDAWEAFHDRMPGKTPTLRVKGTCRCPTPGYTLELRRHERQGTNPKDLLMKLVETKPTGPEPEVITDTIAEYTDETDFEYVTVSIVPGGPAGIPVRDVSRS